MSVTEPTAPEQPVRPAEGAQSIQQTPNDGCARLIVGGLLSLALMTGLAIASLMPVIVFTWAQAETANDAARPAYATPLLALAQAGLMTLACAPMLLARAWPRVRSVATLWLVGSLLIILFAPLHALSISQDVPAYALTVLLAFAALAVLRTWARKRGLLQPLNLWQGAGVVPLIVFLWLPWLIRGALGSVLDGVLAALVACAFGLWLATLDALVLAPAFARVPQPGRSGTLLRGLALGVLAMLLATALGFQGHALLLMASVAPLGVAFAALARLPSAPGRALAPLAALAAGAAFAPLAFTDTKEFSIVLGGDDIPGVLPATAALAFVLALAVCCVLWLWPRVVLVQRKPARATLMIGALIAAALAYFVLGQPGLYADRVFVILRDSADLTAARGLPNRDARGAAIYKVLTTHANASQLGLRSQLGSFGFAYRPYYLVNAIEIESPLDGGALLSLWLGARNDVDRVLASPHHHPLSRSLGGLPAPKSTAPGDVPASAPKATPWGLRQTGADRVWSGFDVRGAGIVIGNTDSGIDGPHEALRDSYRGAKPGLLNGDQFNWFDPWGGQPSPVDYGEHGTHTTGSMLGKTTGVAPDAQWIGCVNLARNLGNPAVYLDCMQFMFAPHPQHGDPFTAGKPELGAHIINNSWGCPPLEGCDANVYLDAVRALRAAGIFMAVSAGNSGPSCSSVTSAPALYADVFTVGAVDSRGNIAGFSSRGPVQVDGSGRTKPDVIAPGVAVLSSVPHNKYEENSGTSMAGPHVAGIVALIWSANPKLIGNIDRTEAILRETAAPYTGERAIGCFSTSSTANVSNAYGHGVVDAFAAVKQAIAER